MGRKDPLEWEMATHSSILAWKIPWAEEPVEPGRFHGISQTKILEWVAIPFSRGSSLPRDRMWVFCIAGSFFTI